MAGLRMREYFQGVERDLFDAVPHASIPIKKSTFGATVLTPSRSGSREVTSREATALLIVTKAAGSCLEPGSVAPRSFMLFDDEWIIENGCGQDISRSGLADIDQGRTPRDDRFILSARFVHWVETAARRGRLDEFMNSPPSPQP